MNIIDVIEKKKVNKELTEEEIKYFIDGYTKGEITDYQAAALVMAICINGMTEDEIVYLTDAMAQSGEMMDFSDISDKIVDKHSTGGIGDKVTLLAGPIIAALDIPVAKMSGRGLGITGGTIDKLESIPGYRTEIPVEEFKQNVKDIGICIAGQTANLAPADKKIYALRDTIGCTNSTPLIASSIMSKKFASGANAIVLDVTCGSGAFMPDKKSAIKLAKLMSLIGKLRDRETVCLITNMDEPLGRAVGNSLEVIEVIESLKGNMALDVKEVIVNVCIQMMVLSGKYPDIFKCNEKIEEVLKNGKAFEKFRQMVERQGGDVSYIDNPEKFEKAPIITPVISDQAGYVETLNAYEIGRASVNLGAGRIKKENTIDHRVGITFEKKIGDKVEVGDILAYVHASSPEKSLECVEQVKNAYTFGPNKVEKKNILDIITND